MKTQLARVLGVAAVGAAILAGGTARAESRIEKNLRLEPGGTFTLNTDLGAVKVRGTDRSGARIVVTSRREELEELLRFQFDEGSGSVTVTARKRHPISSFFGSNRASVAFEIEVPSKTRVNVDTSGGAIRLEALAGDTKLDTSGGGVDVHDHTGSVDAHSSGGGIELARVKGKCNVETSGGGITADDIDGSLDADTSGGSIHLSVVRGNIKAHTSGGGIRIREAGGRVEADTSGGSVQASFTKGNARGGTIESSGGGVSVSIDPGIGLAIDASGNSVDSELPLTVRGEISRQHLHGVLGGGGETLRLRTSGGSVHIKPL